MTIQVDYAVVEAAAKNFANRQEHLVQILDTLEAGLAPMLASWEGAARDLYLEKKALWDKSAADLGALLTMISTHTQKAHDGYAEVVSEQQDGLGKLRGTRHGTEQTDQGRHREDEAPNCRPSAPSRRAWPTTRG